MITWSSLAALHPSSQQKYKLSNDFGQKLGISGMYPVLPVDLEFCFSPDRFSCGALPRLSPICPADHKARIANRRRRYYCTTFNREEWKPGGGRGKGVSCRILSCWLEASRKRKRTNKALCHSSNSCSLIPHRRDRTEQYIALGYPGMCGTVRTQRSNVVTSPEQRNFVES